MTMMGIPQATPPIGFLRGAAGPPLWRKRADELYDMLTIEKLGTPTACIEWFPWCSRSGSSTRSTLLLGTNAARQSRNYLKVLRVHLPAASDETDGAEDGSSALQQSETVTTQQTINHPGPVSHAKYSPLNPYFVATATVTGEVMLFNLQSSPLKAPPDGRCHPTAHLLGHNAACRSVSWNPHEEGILLSSSVDSTLCIWDVVDNKAVPNKLLGPGSTVRPLRTFDQSHGAGGVHAAAFHPDHQYLIGSAGGDGRLCLWDARADGRSWSCSKVTSGVAKPVFETHAHVGGASSMAFSPHSKTLLATGGRDKMIRIWDLRQPKEALQGLAGHQGNVLSVEWSSEDCKLLASSSDDKRVLVWDYQRAGCTVHEDVDRWHLFAQGKPEPVRSGAFKGLARAKGSTPQGRYAPELAMLHCAHDSAITSLAWGRGIESKLIASADAGGFLHLWQPARQLLEEGQSLAGDFGPAGRSLWGCFND